MAISLNAKLILNFAYMCFGPIFTLFGTEYLAKRMSCIRRAQHISAVNQDHAVYKIVNEVCAKYGVDRKQIQIYTNKNGRALASFGYFDVVSRKYNIILSKHVALLAEYDYTNTPLITKNVIKDNTCGVYFKNTDGIYILAYNVDHRVLRKNCSYQQMNSLVDQISTINIQTKDRYKFIIAHEIAHFDQNNILIKSICNRFMKQIGWCHYYEYYCDKKASSVYFDSGIAYMSFRIDTDVAIASTYKLIGYTWQRKASFTHPSFSNRLKNITQSLPKL